MFGNSALSCERLWSVLTVKVCKDSKHNRITQNMTTVWFYTHSVLTFVNFCCLKLTTDKNLDVNPRLVSKLCTLE